MKKESKERRAKSKEQNAFLSLLAVNHCLLFCLALCTTVLFSCNFSFGGKDGEEKSETWDTAQPLQEIYRSYFLLGNVVSPGDLGTMRFDLLRRHYNTATAENAMKPDAIAPNVQPAGSDWAYRFSQADSVVNAVKTAGMEMHGHTLVWHSQTPAWLTTGSKGTVVANLEKYAGEVVEHFKGKLVSWDVVNEAMRDGLTDTEANGNWEDCLRLNDLPGQANSGSAWNRAIGPEYIERAFLAARAADPDVILYYNDFNLNNAYKAKAVYNMVRDINLRYPNVGGRPLIDGIGMQSHHHIFTDPRTVEDSINLFASLGVEIAISEMEIMAAGTFGINPAVSWGDYAARLQAEQYAAMFRIFKANASKIKRVTFWGIDDKTSWRASTYPTLLDENYGLKPAFYAVANPERY